MAKAKIMVGKRQYKSYAEAVRNRLGLSKEEYTKEYDVFKHRVRNYVQATGDKVSAAKEFFFYKMHQAKVQRNIELLQQGKKPLEIKTSHLLGVLERMSAKTYAKGVLTQRDVDIAAEQIKYRFSEMAKRNLQAAEVMQQLELGKIDPDVAKAKFDDISKIMKEYKTTDPERYVSDAVVGSM